MTYIDIGNKNSPTLVFIHGLGSRKEAWTKQFELAEYFRVIAPDLRGHGESEITEGLTVENMAQDIINLLDSLNITKAIFCGLSLGGIVVQRILEKHSEYVDKAILANTTPFIPVSIGGIAVERCKKLLEEMSTDEFAEAVIRDCLYDYHNEELIKEMKDTFLKIKRDTYVECSKSGLGRNHYYTLMSTKKPVLIIGSLEDNVTPYINVTIMSFLLPNSRVVKIDKCGHASNVEKPDDFNNAIREFLNV